MSHETRPMESRRRRYLLLATALVLAVVGVAAVPGAVAAGDGTPGSDGTVAEVDDSVEPDDGTNVTILQYNDIQTAMADSETMGRLVGAVNDRKAALDNPTLVVGGGDEVSPSSLSAVSEWRVPVDALNVLNPDAEVVGNHDLDYGFEPVAEFSNASEFPWLAANIRAEDGGNVPGTQNYTTVERGGVRFGILGLVDDAIDPKTAVDFEEEGYEVTDWSTAGRQVATTLVEEENVDVVVALTHTGISESREIANNTDNIDVIVSGDDEVLYEPTATSGSVVVEAGGEATHLGEVNLSVSEQGVGFTDGRLYELESGEWSVNATASDVVEAGRTEDLATVAGETTEPLDSTFANYADDTGWGRIIGDAFLAQTDADVAMTNAGGIRGNFVIEEGELTYDDIYTSLPFGNTLVTKEMTGAEIVDYLATTASSFDSDFGVQPELQVGGISYEIVDRPGPSQKVTDVYVRGDPIEMDRTYEVAVNSYMAGGPLLSEYETVDEDLTLYGTAAVNYIEQQGTVTPPAEDRIRRTTRTLGEPSIEMSEETVTLSYDVPEAVDSIQESTFTLMNETDGRLDVREVDLSDGSLLLTVNRSDLLALSERSDTVQLYGTYSDAEIDSDRNGFETSRLNGDAILPEAAVLETELEAVRSELEETRSALEETQSELESARSELEQREEEISDLEAQLEDAESESESENEDSDSNGPGFTAVAAAIAMLGAALLALRQRE